MEVKENIVNKVALSGLVTLDLEKYAPQGEVVIYDIKDNLFQGLILKEKDFRNFLSNHDWTNYLGKHVGIICSADAIVPTWAYMLLTTKLEPYAASIHFGDEYFVNSFLFDRALVQIDFDVFKDQRVVVKGCGATPIPTSAFVTFTAELSKVAKSIMYGEPCSTVPIFKRKK